MGLFPDSWLHFPSFCRFSIVNEKNRRERGLLVLICPGGSLGITINSQLWAHSIGRHRHCQFVPIRVASLWVSAARGCSGPIGEQQTGPGLGLLLPRPIRKYLLEQSTYSLLHLILCYKESLALEAKFIQKKYFFLFILFTIIGNKISA